MNRNTKYAASVAIIGSADGPTSIYIAGKSVKLSTRQRIQKYIASYKRKRAEKQINASGHTLQAVAAYAIENYHAAEVPAGQKKYTDRQQEHKENLLFRQEAQGKAFATVPDREIPMDYHIYEIKIGENCLDVEMDYIWDVFDVSYSGNKKVMKQFRKIVKDLYVYYGVTQADINEKTARYSCLLSVLSS